MDPSGNGPLQPPSPQLGIARNPILIAFFSILIAIVLLGVTVYGLHRYQTMEVEYQVDRTMPLPPLKRGSQPNFLERARAGNQDLPPEMESDATSAEKEDVDKPKVSPKPASQAPTWQTRVAAAKRDGDINQAMALCAEQLPLWGAYNQLCILLRGQFKAAGLEENEKQALLTRLYQTAVAAELLHDKSHDSPRLSLTQLRDRDFRQVELLPMDYEKIGYAQLRLIRKSDIKEMLAAWGRPEAHRLPREVFEDWWLEFAKS